MTSACMQIYNALSAARLMVMWFHPDVAIMYLERQNLTCFMTDASISALY